MNIRIFSGVKIFAVCIVGFAFSGCNVIGGLFGGDVRLYPRDRRVSVDPPQVYLPTQNVEGWTDMPLLLVPSDGTRSLGADAVFNGTRDQGSKVVYFDTDLGNNDTAEVYWWNGTHIIDSAGNTANADGEEYGTDPLQPNSDAILAFEFPNGIRSNSAPDLRLRSHSFDFNAVAAGYADWFLFRRGETHRTFDADLFGGMNAAHPMVIAGYGPVGDGRAVFDPAVSDIEFQGDVRASDDNPFASTLQGGNQGMVHMLFFGIEFRKGPGIEGLSEVDDTAAGEPTSMHFEDCRFLNATIQGVAKQLTVYRTVSAFSYNAGAHNQGYFTHGYGNSALFDEVVFYKNGYKQDPRAYGDPRRDIFSRNVYQGGGAQMGHVFRNVISADGASGGPQMRLGGLCENSLVIEGYWFSSTNSNELVNPWLTAGAQSGQSAVVRNNVQLIFTYPSAADPDTNPADDKSDVASQPGDGYLLGSASFGSEIYGNIISAAMLRQELGFSTLGRGGIILDTYPEEYDGTPYSQRNNRIYDNIVYGTGVGLSTLAYRLDRSGDWSLAQGVVVEDNVFAAQRAVSLSAANITSTAQLNIRDNRFYADDALPARAELGTGNMLSSMSSAAAAEGWPDPDRTLLRYVTEEMGLALLDWNDDPYLNLTELESRRSGGEEYDPTGLKTFMAVATNMRRGGVSGIPTAGNKPSWIADYEWDPRFTAVAVVNWIREGFALDPVPDP